jgi:SAM-dependent methyltransferase
MGGEWVQGDAWDPNGETQKAYEEFAEEYARRSQSYDTFPGLKSVLEEFNQRVPQHLPVLDAGCGGGRDSLELARLGRRVFAFDLSESLLKAWPTVVGEPQIHRLVGDLYRPPFFNESIGGVWACASLIHQPPDVIPETIGRLISLLVTDGCLTVTMRLNGATGPSAFGTIPSPRWVTIIPPQQLVDILKSRGLKETAWRESGPGWYAAWGRVR